jgi:alkyl sulfatase BDS1-like metallo-beta-lactamase superfamily hydrolase
MTRFRTLDHIVLPMISWAPQRPAERINDHIAMVHATSNSYLVPGVEGDVVINSGTEQQGVRIREKFEELLGRPLHVRKLIFTQNHTDHLGGFKAFAGPHTEIIAQRLTSQLVAERRALTDFFTRRYTAVISAMMVGANQQVGAPEVVPEGMTTFDDEFEFTLGGRHFKLTRLWAGETLDSIAVLLPEEQTVFTGNWAGAIHGALPNFYTARGDRQRSVPAWLEQCRAIVAQEPEMLITGHEQPIVGKDKIRADLMKVHDAIRLIHDETVSGMEAGETLAALMSRIRLPEELTPRDGRCPVAWIVRAVYEEYAGWFRHERTSELYATPQSVIWPELVESAGGAEQVALKARCELEAGNPVKALHFIEMAVFVAPADAAVREAEIAVLDALADETGGRIFDLLGWLEGRIAAARKAIA